MPPPARSASVIIWSVILAMVLLDVAALPDQQNEPMARVGGCDVDGLARHTAALAELNELARRQAHCGVRLCVIAEVVEELAGLAGRVL
jgi:hypothetical protein